MNSRGNSTGCGISMEVQNCWVRSQGRRDERFSLWSIGYTREYPGPEERLGESEP